MSRSVDTRPFAPFEWMLALRYLRARRKEGFISVIAGFSFVGILLGVATLIIVMAVMNGFRNQLFEKILGINGHIVVYKLTSTGPFDNYPDVAARIERTPGVKHVVPLIEGQVMVSSPLQALGAYVRGISEKGLSALPLVSSNIISGTLEGFDQQTGIAIGSRLTSSARRLPSCSRACMRAREAAVSAVSEPEKKAEATMRISTKIAVMRSSMGVLRSLGPTADQVKI